jgi:hypothetical protein
MKQLPSQKYLQECFFYNPETGELIWRERPENHFTSVRSHRSWNGKNQGKVVSYLNRTGYLLASVNGVRYTVHRLVWKLIYNTDPSIIDHIDTNTKNNRLINLREVTPAQNSRNSKLSRRNTTGFKGVSPSKNHRFQAQIRINGMNTSLGSRFSTPEEAYAVYCAAAIDHYKEYANLGATSVK